MIRKFFILTGALILFLTNACAQEKFPFVGEIISDRVNVRAGPNINFERLIQFNKGEEAVVVDKNYTWFKVKLPVKAICYIKADFIKGLSEDIGEVTGDRVRLRAGAGENFSAIGKLDKGTIVRYTELINGWYRIEPVEGSYGYVSEEFIKFKSETIPPPYIIAQPVRNIDHKEGLAEQVQTTETLVPVTTEPLTVTGQLVDQGRMIRSKELRYKLVTDGKPMYFLIGDSSAFNDIIDRNVELKGNIKNYPAGTYKYPVLIVSEVKALP